MWKSEAFWHVLNDSTMDSDRRSLTYRGLGDTIALNSVGTTSEETYPYHEVASQWHRRPRVMFPCPRIILDTYLPLASATFHKFRVRTADPTRTEGNDKKIHVLGDNGLNFALNDNRQPSISIEATALFELVQLIPNCPSVDTPRWLEKLQDTWPHSMCLLMFNPENGIRGVFAEHRFWAALLLHKYKDKQGLKTPYSVPQIRSWCPTEILDDFTACVGDELAMQVAHTVADQNFDGAPDLFVYGPQAPVIWFVEVKSMSDTLKPNQLAMLQALSSLDKVTCQICCPESARSKFAKYELDTRDTDSD